MLVMQVWMQDDKYDLIGRETTTGYLNSIEERDPTPQGGKSSFTGENGYLLSYCVWR